MDERKESILLVDDCPEDQVIYRRYLEKEAHGRYRCLDAQNGEAGMTLCRTEEVDCVLLDYMLPDINGLDFLEIMAHDISLASIPVILLTGQGSEMIAVEAMKRGVMDYLVKDTITPELLVRTVQYAIEKKKSIIERQRHFSFLNTLLDTIPNPIFFKNRDGIFQGCNKAFETFLGLRKEQIIGKTAYDIVPHEQADIHSEVDSKLLEGPGSQVFEGAVDLKDGAQRDVICTWATYTSGSEIVDGLVGVITDITEHKRAQKEREQLIADLREALANVKILRGLIPICAWCKKIRDDTGYWTQLEAYISEHSEADFSHGVCPECARKVQAEIESLVCSRPR